MRKAYSDDIRRRGIEFVEEGRSPKEVAKLLKINRSTIYLWIKKKREEGILVAKKNWQKGWGNKIVDLEQFKEFVEKNQGMTAIEMAKELGNITGKTVCKWLNRIGFTRKKRLTGTKNGKKKIGDFIWKN